jgi:hypothetical protein
MAEKMVRCTRCHYVFDASEGPCIKCGTPYQEPTAAPPVIEGLYSEKYGTFQPEPEPQMMAAPIKRNNTPYMIYGGIALAAAVVVTALLFSLGLGGSAGPTATPARAIQAAPSIEHTLPPTVDATLAQLNDRNFSAHVSVQSHVQVAATNSSKAMIAAVKYDGVISGGNQWGILKSNSTTQEAMLVDGLVWVRNPPTKKWTAASAMSSYKVLYPMFGLKDANALTMVGQETKYGQVLNHLQSTHWWTPDLSRLAMYDMTFLSAGLAPDVMSLDLWTTSEGTPVSATFSAKTMAGQVALVDIEVSYAFTNVGQAVAIFQPDARYTESPGPVGATAKP